MAKNKRKVYGMDETGKEEETRPCAACGCRHFDVYRKDVTGKVRQRICRNCGTVVAAN